MMRPKKKPALNEESRFSKAPAGYSLTTPPGKWPWERPPEITTPGEAVDTVINNIEQPEAMEEHLQLLAAGVSIEEIVGTISRVGFMEGKWSVDVAEIIKAPLAIYFMGLATEYDIPAKVFTTPTGFPRRNYGMKQQQLLNIMRDRNPELASMVMTQSRQSYQAAHQMDMQRQDRERMMQEDSFLGVEAAPIEGEVVESPEEEMMEQAVEQEMPEQEGEIEE